MQELNTTASEKIFHCYKDGEWVETFGVWAVSEDQIEIVNEKKLTCPNTMKSVSLN